MSLYIFIDVGKRQPGQAVEGSLTASCSQTAPKGNNYSDFYHFRSVGQPWKFL